MAVGMRASPWLLLLLLLVLLPLLTFCWSYQRMCCLPFKYVIQIGDIFPHGDHKLPGNDRWQKMAGCAGKCNTHTK